jgi:hypothetical protein
MPALSSDKRDTRPDRSFPLIEIYFEESVFIAKH